MKELNYKKMVEDIDVIVNNDWGCEMDLKTMPHSKPYTQKEAREMANAIGRIYMISHGIACSCGNKYRE